MRSNTATPDPIVAVRKWPTADHHQDLSKIFTPTLPK
jgi:hypothetical protein